MNFIRLLRDKNPLVHCITNAVSANDCANALLCLGARPVMAEHPEEVSDITAASAALLINMGMPSDSKLLAMKRSVMRAKADNIPYVLDCVGVSSSRLRLKAARELTEIYAPAVIRGNSSEISAMLSGRLTMNGVDASGRIPAQAEISEAAVSFNSTFAMSGKYDIIISGNNMGIVKNGSRSLSEVTGTGCMLGAITAAFLSVAEAFDAARYASLVMGICGETAQRDRGLGTYKIQLFDALSNIDDALVFRMKKEEYGTTAL